jgi:homoserine dehydrogenase
MNQGMTMTDVDCTGISGLTSADIESAKAENQRWKLIGTLENVDGRIQGSVKPVRVDATHPLYGVGGATNAITFSTDVLGDVSLIGPGAGRKETGYAIIGDILSFAR